VGSEMGDIAVFLCSTDKYARRGCSAEVLTECEKEQDCCSILQVKVVTSQEAILKTEPRASQVLKCRLAID
jgi:hypothetical protein